MTSANEEARRLTELERLLETWGGDLSRWPADVRRRIDGLASASPRARAVLDEARALDRLLDDARDTPAVLSPAAERALADRIVAVALAEPRALATTAQVIELPTRRQRPVPAVFARPTSGSRWQAAGLMAASLLAGIYLGGSINLAPVMQELAEVVGLQTVVDPTLTALGEDLGDEEAL